MTRYRVPVADPLLEQADTWAPVEGFRLISVDGPWLNHPHVTICTFDDDDAPAVLEGKLVEPVLRRDADGIVTIIERPVVPEA
jgi:hypothetical protein